jgi:predicted RNA-binding Zn-ribbon protein involved in translation (DUF1610 family)
MNIEVVCSTCMQIHGRDTRRAVVCPKCGEMVGCFWHPGKATTHIKTCKGRTPEAVEKEGE